MVEPRVVPRAEHPLSRRDIDPDALKVLYRLRAGRSHRVPRRRQRPRSAARPPAQGLRHRHVRASLPGQEALSQLLDHRPPVPARARQVRPEGHRGRHVPAPGAAGRGSGPGRRAGAGPGHARRRAPDPPRQHVRHAGRGRVPARLHDQRARLRHRDVLDHRLRRRPRRSARGHRPIDRRPGSPVPRRSRPDAARRGARRAPRLHDRSRRSSRPSALHRHEIAKARRPRLLEEYYKILRAGSAEKTFRRLAEVGLLEPVSVELHRGAVDPLWRSLAAVDAYRRRFEATPDTLHQSVLLGSLLGPLGLIPSAALRQPALRRPTRLPTADGAGPRRNR